MCEVEIHKRPVFQLVHRYRCHGLIDRDNFLEFKKTYEELVEKLQKKKEGDKEKPGKLWKYVRSLFAFDDYADCVPINAANLSVLFHPVQECMNAMAIQWNLDISIQKRKSPFVYTIYEARKLIASHLNAKPEDVAIQRNGSDPNGVINNGLDYAKGDNIVYFDQNHPTNGESAFLIRQQRFPNIEIRSVSVDMATVTLESIKEAFAKQIDKHTRLVTFSEVSHLTGLRIPTKELIQKIRQLQVGNQHIHIHVDVAQSWGVFPHDVQDLGCDSLGGGAHKWFLGPKETGMLYMTKEAAMKFWPKDIGYDGSMEAPAVDLHGDASRFEMVGQRNDTNLIGLLYTADILELIGLANIQKRIKHLVKHLRHRLHTLSKDVLHKFTIETPADENLFEGILVIVFKEDDVNTQAYDALYEDYKIAVSTKKGNRMRFSPHIYNTEDHINRCVDALGELLNQSVPGQG